MKVLMNAISAKRGGILTYTGNLLSSLVERGIRLQVAVSPEFEVPEGVEAIRVNVADYHPGHRLLWEQVIWPRMVARLKPDVLFSSANFGLLRSPVPQLLLMREGGLFDPLYLSHISPHHGLRPALMRTLRRALMLTSVRHAHRVMTPSQAMKDLLTLWLPDMADKITVNRYGTLDTVFAPPAGGRAWRQDGVLRLLMVSVYYPHKNPGDVCRAVEMLEAQGIAAHATITMTIDELKRSVGSDLDVRAFERLQAAGKLTLGRVPYHQLPELYASHDAFVFPAVAETFGHPMAEALSSGLPVVVADTPVAREVCGDNALYAPPFKAAGYVERLLELDRDPALRGRLAAGGRAHVLSELRWQDHVDRLVALFEEMRRP